MNPLPSPTETQWLFKTQAMTEMAIEVCKLALEGREFSANDLVLDDHGGSGIAGSVFRTLAAHGAIAPVFHYYGCAQVQKTVRNGGGNRIGVWKLNCERTARRIASLPKPEAQLSFL
jgi:hypothetical protein